MRGRNSSKYYRRNSYKKRKLRNILIISGIIDIRKDDVLAAVAENGFTVVNEAYKENWCAFVLKQN